jgi:hypothetical protein
MLNIRSLQGSFNNLGISGITGLMGQSAHTHDFFDTKCKVQSGGLRQYGEKLCTLRAFPLVQGLPVQRDLTCGWRQLPT